MTETENNALIPTETDETPEGGVVTPENADDTAEGESGTYAHEYVKGLREESKGHRLRAESAEARANELEKHSDELAKRLHRELVTATGRLENPDDLPFDAENLNSDHLNAAIEALLSNRPYLAKRKITGDIGQGSRGEAAKPVSLLEILNRS